MKIISFLISFAFAWVAVNFGITYVLDGLVDENQFYPDALINFTDHGFVRISYFAAFWKILSNLFGNPMLSVYIALDYFHYPVAIIISSITALSWMAPKKEAKEED